MSKKLLHNDFWAQKWFDKCVQALLIFLPWSTVLSVFLVYKIGVPGGNFLKEILLGIIGILWLVLIFNKWKTAKKFPIQWGWLDSIILAYILMMTVVTIFTTGVRGLIFGGRYDFIFLIVFWIFYHGSDFLKFPVMHYIRMFRHGILAVRLQFFMELMVRVFDDFRGFLMAQIRWVPF